MSRLQFWILNGLSGAIALLVLFELRSSDQLDHAQMLAQEAQVPLLRAQQAQPAAQRMVQRTAQGAMHDPALRELLAHYGIHLEVNPAGSSPAALSEKTSAAETAATTSNP